MNRALGIRRSYINESSRVAQEFLKRDLQTMVFANSRLHTELLLTYLQQANPQTPGQAGNHSRLSRRLSAERTPRNRTRPARRTHPWRGFHQRAGVGHRRRLAGHRRHGRLSRHHRRNLAARRTRRAPQWKLLRRAGGLFRAARSIHRAPSGLFFRQHAGARFHTARQSGNPDQSSEMRCVRAARSRRTKNSAMSIFPIFARALPKPAFCIARERIITGRMKPIPRTP